MQVVGISSQKQAFLLQTPLEGGLPSDNQPVFTLCPRSDASQPVKKFHSGNTQWLV